MVTADARNYRRLNVSFPCHSEWIIHHYARPLLLYPPMPYSQASGHSVTDDLTKTMLLIDIPLVVKYWRNFIHSWRSWRWHSWSRCGPYCLPFFSKWRSRFENYRDGGMTCDAWLRLPINNSSVSVLIFVEANAYFMSVIHTVCFSSGRNTLRKWVFMSHPRHVLFSDSFPFPISFLKDSGSSCFRGSYGFSGRKSVCMTNRATRFARSIQFLSSAGMVMMYSMNLPIDASVDVISTAKGSAVVRWLVDGCFSSCGSNDWCGEFRSSVSQDSSWSGFFPGQLPLH